MMRLEFIDTDHKNNSTFNVFRRNKTAINTLDLAVNKLVTPGAFHDSNEFILPLFRDMALKRDEYWPSK